MLTALPHKKKGLRLHRTLKRVNTSKRLSLLNLNSVLRKNFNFCDLSYVHHPVSHKFWVLFTVSWEIWNKYGTALTSMSWAHIPYRICFFLYKILSELWKLMNELFFKQQIHEMPSMTALYTWCKKELFKFSHFIILT